MSGRGQFSVLPDEIFLYLLSFVNPSELITLQTISKHWQKSITKLLDDPDLITSLMQDLSENDVQEVIEAYSTKPAYQFIANPSYEKKSPWHFLNHSITLDKPEDTSKLPNAFFSVVRKLPVSEVGNFISNYRLTSSCQALLTLPQENQSHIHTISHALLCNQIKEIDSDKLKAAISWAKSVYRAEKNMQSLLRGLEVTLSVRDGKKELPKKSSYYINLRGADLSKADLIGIDFRHMDLKGAKMNLSNLATDINLSKTVGFIVLIGLIKSLSEPSFSIHLAMLIIILSFYWLSKSTTNQSNLNGVDLRNANLEDVEFGQTSLFKTKISGAKLKSAGKICEADFTGIIFFDKLTSQTICTELDKRLEFANIANFQAAMANNIVMLAKKMPRQEAIDVIQKAMAHSFFTPAARPSNLYNCLSNFSMMARSGQTFFQSFNLPGKKILAKALNEIQPSETLHHQTKPTLKRKFSNM